MVYAAAARKTFAFMALAGVLSLGVVTFFSGEITGRVASPGVVSETTGSGWIVFVLGAFMGALLVGTYTYLVHVEGKREE